MGECSIATTLQLRVRRLGWEAPGVISLELVSPDGAALPAYEPGAHVDLTLPDGTIRQYSLCGDPADTSCYRIAVREVAGGVASGTIHGRLPPGSLLTIGLPRNNFPLLPSLNYLFVAGGIGITPLLPMMRAAHAAGARWSLLFCTRRSADAPFLAEVLALGGTVSVHASEESSRLDVSVLAEPRPDTLLYCCGPDRLMLAVEDATAAWPAGSVNFEWFRPRARSAADATGGFEVVCARSGMSLMVSPEKSVLQTLLLAGIDISSSCEQGVCGTCECRVLDGEVDHRDSILSAAEQASNRMMMTCVSRAKGARLVLDI